MNKKIIASKYEPVELQNLLDLLICCEITKAEFKLLQYAMYVNFDLYKRLLDHILYNEKKYFCCVITVHDSCANRETKYDDFRELLNYIKICEES